MSYYYRYNFISPEPIYAQVKEELKSYFDTGAVDDTLFTIHTARCMKKLGAGTQKINETFLIINDYQSRLPENFSMVREAWLCTDICDEHQLPVADYTQLTTRLDEPDVFCNPCSQCENPDIIEAIYKTTHKVLFRTTRKFLLTPGNASVKRNCSTDCANLTVTTPESFDIRDNKFIVSFRNGIVYLVFYADLKDEKGYQLIPDNERVKEYLESFLKYKVFEQLSNQASDETFKQMEQKLMRYQLESYEKQVLAETEMKKETVFQKRYASIKTMRRNNKYNIN